MFVYLQLICHKDLVIMFIIHLHYHFPEVFFQWFNSSMELLYPCVIFYKNTYIKNLDIFEEYLDFLAFMSPPRNDFFDLS